MYSIDGDYGMTSQKSDFYGLPFYFLFPIYGYPQFIFGYPQFIFGYPKINYGYP